MSSLEVFICLLTCGFICAYLGGQKQAVTGQQVSGQEQPGNGVELDATVAKTLLAEGDTYFD